MINMAALKRMGNRYGITISLEAYSELDRLASELALNAIKKAKKDLPNTKLNEEHFK